MTQQEARALVRKECRRRKRTWGEQNKAELRAMRAELTFLNEHPSIAKRVGSLHFGTRIAVPDSGGAYINIRRPGRH